MARVERTATSMKVLGYVRVSTDEQATSGVSLEAQRAKLEAYASLYDLELVEVIPDAGVSAKSFDRPGLQRALGMLRRGKAQGLLVAKLDRLTRSMRDLGTLVEEELVKGKWTLLSVADQLDTRTASGRLVLNILGSVATWERDVVAERTKEALSYKRSRGERTSLHAPYGYRVVTGGKVLEADEVEQAMLAAIREARARGLSGRAIVAELAAKGCTTRKGTALRLTQVQRIMRQAAIA
jgi:DNA invertase Pin-like site-specific DNA recombinase